MNKACEVRVSALPDGVDAVWLGVRREKTSEWALIQCDILHKRPITSEEIDALKLSGDIVQVETEEDWRALAKTDKYTNPDEGE